MSIGSANNLSTLPRLTSFQLLPSLDRAGLNTNHILISLRRRKVRYALRIDPWIPYHNLIQIIPHNSEFLLSSFRNDNWGVCAAGRSIDTIGFASDGKWAGRGSGGADWVGDFVSVR